MKVIDIFRSDLVEILKEMQVDLEPIVEINKGKENGHFSTTIALMLAKKMGKNPKDLATIIGDKLSQKDYYSSVKIAGIGFINVEVKTDLLSTIILNIMNQKDNYGQNEQKNYIINLELVSANPTGWLHLGHARNAVTGDTLKRVWEKDGFNVQTEYYTNDAGNQINVLAVTVFVYYLNMIGVKAELPSVAYKGEAYDEVATMFVAEYGDKFKDIKFTDTQILDQEAHDIFRYKSVAFFMDIIKQQLKDFDVEIEHYSSEQEMYDKHELEKTLELYKEKNATYEKDGALWLRTTDFGDDKDRVLVKSDGTFTYILPDLATHRIRIERTKADKLVNVWGGDHHGYIARMRAGLALLGARPDILDIEMCQMVRLVKDGQEFKMSKRKGTAIWMVDLIELVGKDALRYMLASKSSSSHMELDIGLIQQKTSSNPVYYAQYATARCNSILNQAKEKNIQPKFEKTTLLNHEKEIQLLITLDNFSDIVRIASKNKTPHLICEYIQLISKQFHSYYSDTKIINEEEMELTQYRLGFIQSILQVFKNTFDLIGIEVMTKM
ncbi:arginyl-tRNA synthetase [Williamsoniiplasma luminosum]|uniref:Arginine--tRNA ligase n=1 Tax=Williamsoniiplasma luminosum TaxID=214888 RepID=A0A2K8NUF4_9MOLU|nr:arginine--tRNA ligase [Williamsoniiplasma luminosum]ATZ17472.1 arginyl-tRNA synthetase [Williamsoniiplasma luminosum]